MKSIRLSFGVVAALIAFATASPAQVIDRPSSAIGVAIGDRPRVVGLRITYRDSSLQEVKGVNLSAWTPYGTASADPFRAAERRAHAGDLSTVADGTVNGLAIGFPATGAGSVNGVLIAALGGFTDRSLKGIGVAGASVVSAGEIRGLTAAGVGVEAGGAITGLSVGGIYVYGQKALRGIQIGGGGVWSPGDVSGISLGGLVAGAGGNLSGLAVGTDVYVRGRFRGIGLAPWACCSEGDATGLMFGGLAVGSDSALTGLSIGGVDVFAPKMHGAAVGVIGVRGVDVHAIVLGGMYFKVHEGGQFYGGALAPLNDIEGAQHGMAIGLFNYARELHGAQVGLINVSDNGGSRRILPVLSLR
jgi:hypothetical protein